MDDTLTTFAPGVIMANCRRLGFVWSLVGDDSIVPPTSGVFSPGPDPDVAQVQNIHFNKLYAI